MTKIRIEGDTEREVKRAIELFNTAYDCVDFSQPQPGKNTRYTGRQKWFSYGTLKELDTNSFVNEAN